MSSTTIFLGKLLGLYFIAVSLGMLVSRERTLLALDEMARNGPWMLFSGMVATAVGLSIILGHGVWSGGALAVAINLAGWGALIKGIALLAIPHQRMADAYQAMGLVRFFYGWMVIILALGLWMTLLSFSA
ncbi:hypothetical protein [Chelativorans sp. Marseille-P2723]|uniref:hypothetical protein n=1 Tax=Chelativorans sp. Marseille-P2723 TaxID=2709133 RepID=UPI00156F937B|nr:hypothetical protein [Chelativorans sp. Marseille-P2723]